MKAYCPRCGNVLEAVGSAMVRTTDYSVDAQGDVENFNRHTVEYLEAEFDKPGWNCPNCMVVLDEENDAPLCSKDSIVDFLAEHHREGDRLARVVFAGELLWFEVPDAIGYDALTSEDFDEGSLTRNLLEALESMSRKEG